jgi:hypothetical protein
MLYFLALVIGFILACIFITKAPNQFEQMIEVALSAGQRVIVSFENESFIFKMDGDRMIVNRAKIS